MRWFPCVGIPTSSVHDPPSQAHEGNGSQAAIVGRCSPDGLRPVGVDEQHLNADEDLAVGDAAFRRRFEALCPKAGWFLAESATARRHGIRIARALDVQVRDGAGRCDRGDGVGDGCEVPTSMQRPPRMRHAHSTPASNRCSRAAASRTYASWP